MGGEASLSSALTDIPGMVVGVMATNTEVVERLTAWLGASLEKAIAPHSSTLAWRLPWTEEPGRLQSMGSLRVGHRLSSSSSSSSALQRDKYSGSI